MIEEKTIIKELKAYVAKFDTNALAAASLKVTPAQLSTTVNGKANVIPEKILRKLGYKSKLVYLPLKSVPAPAPKNVPAVAPTTSSDIVAHQAASPRRRTPAEPVVVTGAVGEEVINVRGD